MKKRFKLVVPVLGYGILTMAAMAASLNDTAEPGGYKIQVFNHCQLVSEQVMSPEQIKAYQELQVQQDAMDELEKPIKAIEAQIQQYGDKIDSLTASAIQETDSTLHIDKTLLKQQEQATREFEDFMATHQTKFAALSAQGQQISRVAKEFESAIKASLNNIEHDQIHIVTPTENDSEFHCYSGIRHI